MILVGKVPGPREPDDLDSFLHPLIEELKQLEDGILTWNAHLKKEIILRAHLIVVTADMKAREKLMRHTGNGSSRYCTYCMAHGIWNGKVYAPLSIPKDAPISAKQRGKWRNLDPLKLPMRKNDQWKRDATRITMQMDWKLSKDTGIAWLSTFCQLKSIDFP